MRDPVDYTQPTRKQIAFLTVFPPRSPHVVQEVEVSIDIDRIRSWRTIGLQALFDLPAEDRANWVGGMARSIAERIRETVEAQVAVDLQKELDVKFPCVI